jgi:hypothetical protein
MVLEMFVVPKLIIKLHHVHLDSDESKQAVVIKVLKRPSLCYCFHFRLENFLKISEILDFSLALHSLEIQDILGVSYHNG